MPDGYRREEAMIGIYVFLFLIVCVAIYGLVTGIKDLT